MSTKKIVIIAIVSFVVIAIITGVTLTTFALMKPKDGKEVEKEKISYEIGDILGNLKDSRRYVKCNIVIEITEKDLTKVFDEKSHIIKHEINMIIRSKTEKELEGSEGQRVLQEEITSRLNTIFNTTEITNTYFNEIIMQ